MKTITLNGIELNICSKAELAKFALHHPAFSPIGEPEMILFPAPTVRELVVAAGFTWEKVDGAIPMKLWDQYPPGKFVWYYDPAGPADGEPLSIDRCSLLVGRLLVQKLIEQEIPNA